jgi:hypothetical protein
MVSGLILSRIVAYPFPSAATEALVDSSTERLRRLYLIYTPKDDTSLDLTITDDRWRGRCKELTRACELLCDAMQGGTEYGSNLASLDRYFLHFAMAAQVGR